MLILLFIEDEYRSTFTDLDSLKSKPEEMVPQITQVYTEEQDSKGTSSG